MHFFIHRPREGFSNSYAGRRLKRKDNVDDHYQLIYRLRDESVIKILNGTFTASAYGALSALSLHACQYLFAKESLTQQVVENEILLACGLIAIIPLSLLATKYCRMFPLRIYKHEAS